jgi:hypothetical protein
MDDSNNISEQFSPYLKNSPQSRLWIIALILTCLSILVYRVIIKPNYSNTNIASQIGENLPIVLIVWGIFYALFTRKKSKETQIAFLAILSSFILGSFLSFQYQKQQAQYLVSTVQDEISKLDEGTKNSIKESKSIKYSDSSKSRASGEIGEIEKFIKDCINRTISMRNETTIELQKINWESLLLAQRIKNDPMFSESYFMLKKAKDIFSKSEKAMHAYYDDSYKSIEGLKLSKEFKEELESNFISGMNKSKDLMNKYYELTYDGIIEIENLFKFLSENRNWEIRENKIIFAANDDLSYFNEIMASLQNKFIQQQEIEKEAGKSINASITTMSKAFE